MPASELSLYLTDAYRDSIQDELRTVEAVTRALWARIPRDRPDLEAEHATLLASLVPQIVAAQLRATRAAGGYLGAFLTSELERRSTVEVPDDRIGFARDGRPLVEAMRSPLVGTLGRLKSGASLTQALDFGMRRALFMVSLAVDDAAQQALLVGIDGDGRFSGWQRAVRGTCGACLGAATGPSGGLRFPKHKDCKCVSEPRVRGVRDRFPRPTGAVLFAAMTVTQQDEAVGPEVAERVRAREISLADLVGVSHQVLGDDFLTQAPVAA